MLLGAADRRRSRACIQIEVKRADRRVADGVTRVVHYLAPSEVLSPRTPIAHEIDTLSLQKKTVFHLKQILQTRSSHAL